MTIVSPFVSSQETGQTNCQREWGWKAPLPPRSRFTSSWDGGRRAYYHHQWDRPPTNHNFTSYAALNPVLKTLKWQRLPICNEHNEFSTFHSPLLPPPSLPESTTLKTAPIPYSVSFIFGSWWQGDIVPSLMLWSTLPLTSTQSPVKGNSFTLLGILVWSNLWPGSPQTCFNLGVFFTHRYDNALFLDVLSYPRNLRSPEVESSARPSQRDLPNFPSGVRHSELTMDAGHSSQGHALEMLRVPAL